MRSCLRRQGRFHLGGRGRAALPDVRMKHATGLGRAALPDDVDTRAAQAHPEHPARPSASQGHGAVCPHTRRGRRPGGPSRWSPGAPGRWSGRGRTRRRSSGSRAVGLRGTCARGAATRRRRHRTRPSTPLSTPRSPPARLARRQCEPRVSLTTSRPSCSHHRQSARRHGACWRGPCCCPGWGTRESRPGA